MMSNPAMTSFFSVTAPTAANESAVLVQASEVRIRARPGSASSRSGGLVVTAAAYRSAETSTTTAAMTAITVTTAASSCGMIERGSGWPCRSARWLLTHSLYAATATTAPNTISGTPSTCRPHGTPGKGGSNWTTPRPATTSASAVRLQARNVRSLANVNLGSGSVPSSAGPRGCSLVTRHLQRSPRKYCQKTVGDRGVPHSYTREPVGGRQQGERRVPVTRHSNPALPAGSDWCAVGPPAAWTSRRLAPHLPSGRARKHGGTGLRGMERSPGRLFPHSRLACASAGDQGRRLRLGHPRSLLRFGGPGVQHVLLLARPCLLSVVVLAETRVVPDDRCGPRGVEAAQPAGNMPRRVISYIQAMTAMLMMYTAAASSSISYRIRMSSACNR